MGRNLYVGVNGTARKVNKLYVGVGNKARKVKRAYVGDSWGKAQLFYADLPTTINIHCGMYDTVNFTYAGQSYSVSTTTNTSASITINMQSDSESITFRSSLTSYERTATVTAATTNNIYVRPSNCIFWYGYSEITSMSSYCNITSGTGNNPTSSIMQSGSELCFTANVDSIYSYSYTASYGFNLSFSNSYSTGLDTQIVYGYCTNTMSNTRASSYQLELYRNSSGIHNLRFVCNFEAIYFGSYYD